VLWSAARWALSSVERQAPLSRLLALRSAGIIAIAATATTTTATVTTIGAGLGKNSVSQADKRRWAVKGVYEILFKALSRDPECVPR
jgi:hypothetical protein